MLLKSGAAKVGRRSRRVNDNHRQFLSRLKSTRWTWKTGWTRSRARNDWASGNAVVGESFLAFRHSAKVFLQNLD
jgi:hypothetical protein